MRSTIIGLFLLSAPAALADTPRPSAETLAVTSSAFTNNQSIPREYTCDGVEIAPPLSWSRVPTATQSVAILVDDLDARHFTHWLVTGISPSTTTTSNGLQTSASESMNDKGSTGYAGPCPTAGTHRYEFRVYALDTTLPKSLTRADFTSYITGHVLASGRLVGTYTAR